MKSIVRNLAIISILYFLFGFVTSLNNILIPHLKLACELESDFATAFIQFAFFGAYFLMSLPSAAIIKKIGYKNGIMLGLTIASVGAMLFIPAAQTRIYELFLLGLAVLASGITLMQVAVNPYVSLLGEPSKGASRLSLMGGLNSLGGTLGPYAGGVLLLSSVELSKEKIASFSTEEKLQWLSNQASEVIMPYTLLALFLLLLAAMIYFAKLPDIIFEEETKSAENFSVLNKPKLMLGILGIFFYVGAEVGIESFIIRYGEGLGIENYTKLIGSRFVAAYMLSAMIFRFLGVGLLRKFAPLRVLLISALIAIGLLIVSLSTTGYIALAAAVLVGACNSIMWPVIFPEAIAGLGKHTNTASSYLIMAVVGGAIIPLLMGFVSDKAGIQNAYAIPLVCYVFIGYYGFRFMPKRTSNPSSGAIAP